MDPDVTNFDPMLFLLTLALAEPRILSMFIAIPIFNQSLLPTALRIPVAAVFGLLVVLALMPALAAYPPGGWQLLGLIVKESFIGFVLGFMIAMPFWLVESVGFFIDNQRGASIAATLNPLTGNDSSPLGEMFNQAFIVWFFISGGFILMLGVLYQSFQQWSVLAWTPHFSPDAVDVWLGQLDALVRLGLLLGAPAIIAMFLAEIGLALMSSFVPSLDVFFLAMPIKSALAFLVLLLYFATLFGYAAEHIEALRGTVPFLDRQFR